MALAIGVADGDMGMLSSAAEFASRCHPGQFRATTRVRYVHPARRERVRVELNVILSDSSASAPAGTARFGTQLTRALLETAPHDAVVSGYSHRLSTAGRTAVHQQVPGLHRLRESMLPRELLGRVWDSAITSVPRGSVILAPSLFAPLAAGPAKSSGGQLLVTVHDLVPFTHPETLSAHGARWHRRQILRAQRWADAILVPSAAVAATLEHYAPCGDRVHVVPGAPSPALLGHANEIGSGEGARPYILFVGTLEPRKGLDLLLSAMAHPDMETRETADTRLVVAGATGWGGVNVAEYARAAGLDPSRLDIVGRIDDEELASVIRGARALVAPSRAEGFGLPVVEAMALATPVVHSLDPALSETAHGAGIGVDLSGDKEVAQGRLAAAIARVLTEPGLGAELSSLGIHRAAQFSWVESARRVWQIVRG